MKLGTVPKKGHYFYPVLLNNGTVLNMFWEPVWTLDSTGRTLSLNAALES
jgi:hypothetical protein